MVDAAGVPCRRGLNGNLGQNPSQPAGSVTASNPWRKAFFVGTSTVPTPATAAPIEATATLTSVPGYVASITVLPVAGTMSYSSIPACTITGGGGSGATCSLAAGGFTLAGGILTPPGPSALPFACPACITNGGVPGSYTSTPTVTLDPAVAQSALAFLATSPLLSGTTPTLGSLGSSGAGNAGESCGAPPCAGSGAEDIVFGALQFYDAIASTAIVNFTAAVNNFDSIKAPNLQTSVNASLVVSYSNWQGLPDLPLAPQVPPDQEVFPAFVVMPVGAASFHVSVNSTAALLARWRCRVVVTSLVSFTGSSACGSIESWDSLTLTLSVSATLNAAPENTFQISLCRSLAAL